MDHHRSKPRLPWHWGVLNPNPARRYPHPPITRVILTKASPEALLLWVKQLRRAPYSYDWIDNLGRPSPSTPMPIELQVGERIMYIFTVSSLGPTHVEAYMSHPLATAAFGKVRIRYDVREHGRVSSLHYTMWIPAATMVGKLRRYLLAWADLVMARKQLFTLTRYAEQTPHRRR